jgi:hypothetical protein
MPRPPNKQGTAYAGRVRASNKARSQRARSPRAVEEGHRGAPRLFVATVALARKLSRILYAVWRDGSRYEPQPQLHRQHEKQPPLLLIPTLRRLLST